MGKIVKNMRALIDTCIVIDYLQKRESFFGHADEIFTKSLEGKFIGYLTAKSLTDIYYLMHHYTHSEKESRKIIEKLFDICDILDTKASDCYNAVSSNLPDFEDAIMLETAKSNGIDCIITRNIQDFSASEVPVYTPKQFLERL